MLVGTRVGERDAVMLFVVRVIGSIPINIWIPLLVVIGIAVS